MNVPQQSAWRGISKNSYPELTRSIDVDIAIIGGGMTGVIAAYFLRNSGKKVVLLEQSEVGSVATGLTTAFLIETIDTDPSELISLFGPITAKKVIASHQEAIAFFEEIVRNEHIDCEFMRVPLYKYAHSDEEAGELKEEESAARTLGVAAEYKIAPALPFSDFDYLQINNQAKFHPLKFLYALASCVAQARVEMFEHTKVFSITEGKPVRLKTDKGEVVATNLLIATHYPAIGDHQPFELFFKKGKYISYVLEAHIPKGALPHGLYEDMKNPYHYIRIDQMENYDRLMLGGEDHRADIPVDQETNFEALENHLKELLPGVSYTLTRRWKGPIIEPGDGLAYIGPINEHENIHYATGYSGNGMTYAVTAAKIFVDAVLGIRNEYADIYSAKRSAEVKPHAAKAKDYITEFLFGAVKNIFKFR